MTFTYQDLQKWVSEWEGPAMEFKASVQKDIGEAISAFANTYGGIIVFGVTEKKELKGLQNPDEESRRLRQILDNCKPNPKPEQEFIRHEEKTFIILKIESIPYSHNPCFYGDFCFIRQGTTNLKLTADALIEFLKKRSLLNFEEMRSKAVLDDLDLGKVDEVLRKRNVETKGLKEEDYRKVLAGLGAANYNGDFFLKNVALLFFAKEPQKFFSNLEVRFVRYSGTEKTLEAVKSDERIYGTMPELITQSFGKIMANTGKHLAIVGAERREIPDYPEKSVRELITNSLGHRDYFQIKEVLVEIFDDRVEITNPGGLLVGQTIKNFDRTPQHRNPISYRLLKDLGLGEGLGFGIQTIRKECREARLPDPEFYDIGNMFKAIIHGRESGRKRHLADHENPRQKQGIAYLEKNKTIKAKEYAQLTGASIATAINDLNELIKQGKVRRVGKYRGAHYALNKL